MSVDAETVKRIARLARISVSDDEAQSLQGELSGILSWVEQLGELDVENVPPMTSTVAVAIARREDAVTAGGIAGDVLKNAPETEDGYFVVPKVLE